jgi:GTP pyrophosphokinase
MVPEVLRDILEQPQFDDAGKALISRAYEAARDAHDGQSRADGSPYISHPLHVAHILADLGFDANTIAAALLHDAIEDTSLTRTRIEADFGTQVAFLVDGVSKLKTIQLRGTAKDKKAIDLQSESLKKMFFAMAEDLRVIIIKLADRLHNMRTLEYKDPAARTRKALETLELYAPIADRLGMGRMKGELEDLAFPYAYHDDWLWLKKVVRGKYEDRLRYIERTAPVVRRHLTDGGVTVLDIHARAKRMWSLFRKLKRYEMNPDLVMDLVALRIIVPDIKSCYETLGVIHTHYKPMPGRIKDYIALPKPNGYRSLHTTVFCEKGRLAEIQIRTPEMHDHAEHGVAAHWSYTEAGKRAVTAAQQELAWVNQLKQYLKNIKSSQGMADLKIDFFRDRIFALTPHGDVKDLPEGATAVDFAYAVHSELGHRMTGAMVNGKLVPISHVLQSGDVIEIVRGNKEGKPSRDWLRFVKTSQAIKHIRSWFKKHDPSIAIDDGLELLNKELDKSGLSVDKLNRTQINKLLNNTSSKTLDDLLTHISMRDFDAATIARAIAPTVVVHHKPVFTGSTTSRSSPGATVIIAGQPGLAYKLGRCCMPVAPDAIIGYLTISRGVTVHRTDCQNAKTARDERLLDAAWND